MSAEFHVDAAADRADVEYERPGHLLAYLARRCPPDGMSCGACPRTGCDQGRLREELGERIVQQAAER